MPTTLLDGESWDQAYARRFKEEAEIDAAIEANALPAHKRPGYSERMAEDAEMKRKESQENSL